MEEKKRKSNRSFKLEKGSRRSFDLQKTSARKFDLSKDSDEVSLEELKKDLLADGKIDAEEVKKLREVLFADGKIDQEEADILFEINDAVSGKSNDSSWKTFFVEAISDYLLNDEKTPGVIDEKEGEWLIEKVGADGQVDEVEKKLLIHLKENSKKMPESVMALLSDSIVLPPPSSKPTPPTQSTGGDKAPKGKGKWIAAALVGLLAIGGGGYYLSQKGKDVPLETPVLSDKSDKKEASDGIQKGQNQGNEIPAVPTTADNPSDNSVFESPADPKQNSEVASSGVPSDNTPSAKAAPEQKTDAKPSSVSNPTLPSSSQPAQTETTKVNLIQPKVATSPSDVVGAVEEEAKAVIQGKYGAGIYRKNVLGDRYAEIQGKVNEMYRTGQVYR